MVILSRWPKRDEKLASTNSHVHQAVPSANSQAIRRLARARLRGLRAGQRTSKAPGGELCHNACPSTRLRAGATRHLPLVRVSGAGQASATPAPVWYTALARGAATPSECSTAALLTLRDDAGHRLTSHDREVVARSGCPVAAPSTGHLHARPGVRMGSVRAQESERPVRPSAALRVRT
jgi:hypothetical protein